MLCAERRMCLGVCVCVVDGFSGLRVCGERVTHLPGGSRAD